jgi:predicted Zn-dependent protease
LAALILVATLPASTASAHGDVHEAIAALTQEIAAHPADAKLYLRRGELHRAHQDWSAAGADFDKAQALDPQLIVVELARGEMLAQAGRSEAAQAALDRFLAERPGDVRALTARARVLADKMQWTSAAEDFARAIARAPEPEPALYIEHARALQRAGKHDAALATLDAGAARLGPLITLLQPAIDLEVEAGQFDAALARLAKVIAAAPRKERWLLRRGELLEKAGRPAEAREAYAAAQSALAAVPPERRATAAGQDLAKAIDAALARLELAEGDAK